MLHIKSDHENRIYWCSILEESALRQHLECCCLDLSCIHLDLLQGRWGYSVVNSLKITSASSFLHLLHWYTLIPWIGCPNKFIGASLILGSKQQGISDRVLVRGFTHKNSKVFSLIESCYVSKWKCFYKKRFQCNFKVAITLKSFILSAFLKITKVDITGIIILGMTTLGMSIFTTGVSLSLTILSLVKLFCCE